MLPLVSLISICLAAESPDEAYGRVVKVVDIIEVWSHKELKNMINKIQLIIKN